MAKEKKPKHGPHSHPLAEVFGFPITNQSDEAQRHRHGKLCPFHNRVPSCTKDKVKNPLGVCSILNNNGLAITCPIRFTERNLIVSDAAGFFFPEDSSWTFLPEVKLKDRHGKSAGNIDFVLVSYDKKTGTVTDFGAIEIQGVYISGNVRKPFEQYMKEYKTIKTFDWTKAKDFPRADYLSSSRKRLVPQLIYKGGILHSWNKKTAVVLHEDFFKTLPELPEVSKEHADVAWCIYTLKEDTGKNRYILDKRKIVYTKFKPALDKISIAEPGDVTDFIKTLQKKLKQKVNNKTAYEAPSIKELFDEENDDTA
ncbi:MAG: NotI family restriction endonuclease [Nitrospiraceae bacterium]|nr:NotI family restriction endonuclease [Nitrospiraceae bacterium]